MIDVARRAGVARLRRRIRQPEPAGRHHRGRRRGRDRPARHILALQQVHQPSHGLFTSYEAFIHIIDSMFNQHAKWLKVSREIPWRQPVPSLNYLLSSHVWRQDHNGFSHQDPGFIDHVINKSAEVVRVYLPADANTLLSTYDHCLRSRDYANLHVRGYKEEGTTTTPFDMAMMNDIDRYHLVMDVIDRVPSLGTRAAALRQDLFDRRLAARRYALQHGSDIPVVADWVWPDARGTDHAEFTGVTATGGDNE